MSDPHRRPTRPVSRFHGEQCVRPLPHGASVFTRDGHRLGRVKDSNDRCFLIDVRLAFDYWLSNRAVVSVGRDDVLLGIEKREVGRYLVDIDCLDDFNDLPSVAGGKVPPAATLA